MIEPSTLTRRCRACGYRFESTMSVCPIDRRSLPDEDPAAPELGSYRLVERLGEGGMGAVYRAIHRKLGRTVAIKVLQKHLTADRGIINRFFHEARAANTIRHDHVIEVYDFVEDGDNVYFVMELLRGLDLHDTIHRRPGVAGPMEPARAVRVLEQVAAGLHATHSRNIVHRDLKPENIFLCHRNGVDEFVKIIDFGIAKLDRPDGLSTVAGAVLGTPEYIAPEQARGLNIDGRADIYSLGCIAYEMLTRHQLFGGGTRTEILTKQIKLVPPALRSYVPNLPGGLDTAVLQALAKDPRARPETALQFATNLARALGRELHDPPAFYTRGPRTTGKRTPTSAGLVLRLAPAHQRRSPAKVLAVAALIFALFAVAVATGKGAGGRSNRPVPARAPERAGAIARPPGPVMVTVVLQSSPSGAAILDGTGQAIGVTPFAWSVPAGSERQLTFQRAGFGPLTQRFRATNDGTIAVRLEPEGATAPAPVAAPGPGGGRSGRGPRVPTAALDSLAGTSTSGTTTGHFVE